VQAGEAAELPHTRTHTGPLPDWDVRVTELAGGSSSLWPCGPRQLGGPASEPLPAAPLVVRLRVEPGRPCQRTLGWGGTMTESSAAVRVIMGSPRPIRDAILDDLFLPPARGGAGVSCVRVPIGSSDFSLSPPGPFDTALDAKLLVPCLLEARRRNPSRAARLAMVGSSGYEDVQLARGREPPARHGARLPDSAPLLALARAAAPCPQQGTLQNEPYHDAADYPCMQLDEDMQVHTPYVQNKGGGH
jgi:hypothetical protein